MCHGILENRNGRIAVVLTLTVLLAWARPDCVSSQEKQKPAIDVLMKQWEKDVREQMEKTASLKALAEKYPLVVLPSRKHYGGQEIDRSGYDFVMETSDSRKAQDFHLRFLDGGNACGFSLVRE